MTTPQLPPAPNAGAQDQDPEDFLRTFLGSALRGRGWTAVIAALGAGDTTNWDNTKFAFDQLYLGSAGGRFLDQRLADDGITRPPGIGLGDDGCAQLGLTVRNNKLTQEAFLQALKVFYGQDAVQASATAGAAGPYALSGGEQLLLLVDGVDAIATTFSPQDFRTPGAASALEVAAAITRACASTGTSQAFAVPVPVRGTPGAQTVRVYSGALGLRSSVACTGGLAQNVLLFPEVIQVTSLVSPPAPASLTWDVSTSASAPPALLPAATPVGVMRVYSVPGSPLDLSGLRAGDYVNITGSGFVAANRGSFAVTNVVVTYDPTGATLVQYFDAEAGGATVQTGVAQVALGDVLFFRPTKATTQAQAARTVAVAQTGADVCEVVIPATSEAVRRGVDTGAYLHCAPRIGAKAALGSHETQVTTVSALARDSKGIVTVTTAGAHGLAPGAQVLVDSVAPALTLPPVVAGSVGTPGNPGNTDASPLSQVSRIRVGDTVASSTYGSAALLRPYVGLQVGGNVSAGTSTSACQTLTLTPPGALEGNGGLSWTYAWGTFLPLPVTLERHAMVVPTQGNNASAAVVFGGVTLAAGVPTFRDGVWTSIPAPAPGGTTWAVLPTALSASTGPRSGLTATLLPNGQTVVAGGVSGVNTAALATMDLFDANQAAIVSSAYSLLTARAEAQALAVQTPLGPGVLVVGGRALAQPAVNDALVVALWHLDNLTDAGPWGYTLASSGGPVLAATGKIYGCADFTVAGSLSAAGDAHAVAALLGPWTLEAWVTALEVGGSGATQTLLSYGTTGGALADNILAELDLIWTTGSPQTVQPQVLWQHGAAVTTTIPGPVLTYDPSGWHHVAATKSVNAGDATKFDVQFYWDGQPVGAPVLANVNAAGGTSSVWNLGETAGNTQAFTGRLDDVRVSGAHTDPADTVPPAFYYATGVQTVVAGAPSYVSVSTPTTPAIPGATRSPVDVFTTWLRGRGDTLTAGNGQLLGSAEVFLQGGSAWAPAGSMTWGRSGHTATLLPDGRVLVTGGYAYQLGTSGAPATATSGCWAPCASAEVWDPGTNCWSSAGSMSTPRADHCAAYLPASGKVFVYGGVTDCAGTRPPNTFDYWNPQTGTWSGTPPPPPAPPALLPDIAGPDAATFYSNTLVTSLPVTVKIIAGQTAFAMVISDVGWPVVSITGGGTWTLVGSTNASLDTQSVSLWSTPAGGATGTNVVTVHFGGLTWASASIWQYSGVAAILTAGVVTASGGHGGNPISIALTNTVAGSIVVAGAGTYRAGPDVIGTAIAGTLRTGFGALTLGMDNTAGTTPVSVVNSANISSGEYWDAVAVEIVGGPAAVGQPDPTATAVLLGPEGVLWPAGGAGVIFVEGDDVVGAGDVAGWRTLIAPTSGTTMTFSTPGTPHWTRNANAALVAITPFAAPPGGSTPGPYLWDPSGSSPGITGIKALVGTPLFAGQRYRLLSLSTSVAQSFPAAGGWLVLGFGTSTQVWPVPFLGWVDTQTLALDYDFVFPANVPAGATVICCASKGSFVPAVPEARGSFYLTDSSSARVAAETTLENIAAGGEDVHVVVTYPGDRGLGNEGRGAVGQKFSDAVTVWGSNNLDVDAADARQGLDLQVGVINSSGTFVGGS